MKHPALALLEIDSVAAGIEAADRMVKSAPIALLKTGTVHPGRYLVMVAGTVASVEEGWRVGREAAEHFLRDEVLLPDVHEQVAHGAWGHHQAHEQEALGVVETNGVAALLRAADAAVKGANVMITELRLADDLGGRAFVLLDGPLTEVEAALEIGTAVVQNDRILHCAILPRLDNSLRGLLNAGTRFASCEPCQPEGAEIP